MKFSLPTVLKALLGDLKVAQEASIDGGESFGEASFRDRVIRVDATLDPNAQAQTFFHECVHYALWDSGVHNVLDRDKEEAVCDAVGSFLAKLALNGQLKLLKRPKK
jgi:hypothetical protein